MVTVEPKHCHHCGHDWTPRKANPKKCPQCQNSLWKSAKPKRKNMVHLSEVREFSVDEMESLAQTSSPAADFIESARTKAEELLRRLQ